MFYLVICGFIVMIPSASLLTVFDASLSLMSKRYLPAAMFAVVAAFSVSATLPFEAFKTTIVRFAVIFAE
jgi:hypothetical protein